MIAVDRGHRTPWNDLKRMARDGTVPVVPTPVMVEAWRSSRQARLGRLLRLCRVEPLDEQTARRGGKLGGRADTADPVDAVVVVSAARRGGVVLTSDVDDLTLLAEHVPDRQPLRLVPAPRPGAT